MTNTCFANNLNLLAVLYSLGAKVAHCILCYLASHKWGGGGNDTTTANKPQPFMHAKNGFLNHFIPSLCIGCRTKERLRNFKRRENQGVKRQKEQERRRCFFIKSSLQLYSVFERTKPCKITSRVFGRWHRREEASERRTVPFPMLELVFHVSVSVSPGAHFKVNLMQC